MTDNHKNAAPEGKPTTFRHASRVKVWTFRRSSTWTFEDVAIADLHDSLMILDRGGLTNVISHEHIVRIEMQLTPGATVLTDSEMRKWRLASEEPFDEELRRPESDERPDAKGTAPVHECIICGKPIQDDESVRFDRQQRAMHSACL